MDVEHGAHSFHQELYIGTSGKFRLNGYLLLIFMRNRGSSLFMLKVTAIVDAAKKLDVSLFVASPFTL